MTRYLALVPLCTLAAPALAQVEYLDQIEPGAGETQIQHSSDPGGSSVEVLTGVSALLALGGEAEFEEGRLSEVSGTALFRLADPDKRRFGVGLEFSAALARGGGFGGGEARLIVERRAPRWWLQADGILRHSREDGLQGTGIAYAVSAQRRIAGTWFGVEASGRLARIAGAAELAPQGEHYAGPSLTFDAELGGGAGVEIGLAWLQRLRGTGSKSGPRAFAQFSF